MLFFALNDRGVPEHDPVEIEGVLNDPRGRDSRAQNVLLGRQVFGVTDAVGIADEAVDAKERSLVRSP